MSNKANSDPWLLDPVFRSMRIPQKVFCEPNVSLEAVQLFSNIKIGISSYMNLGMVRYNAIIGRYCAIGRRVTIGASRHPTDWLTTHPFVFGAQFRPPGISFPNFITKVGNDVWIGDNALIMDGITIEDGAIIGASAVVTKDVPAYSIVTGVPARHLRNRFSDATIASLIDLQWWRFHPRHLAKLPFDCVEAAIDQIQQTKSSFEILPDLHRECVPE